MRKLNLGCGGNIIAGWENHDWDVDITKPLPYEDNSIDFIFIEHCVEHTTTPDAVRFFAECLRILKDEGTLRDSGSKCRQDL
jgi:predicted SAM-dependent methyltransferase